VLIARVPTSLAGCAYVGLDPAAWSGMRLIDALVVAPFLSTQPEIPVGEFRRACGSLPIYAGMEYTMGTRGMMRQEKRAVAALHYGAGADGIYLFNYFVMADVGLEMDTEVLGDLSDPEVLSHKDKLYTVAATRHPIPLVTPSSPVPLVVPKMQTRTVTFSTAESQRARSVTLRLEFKEDVAPEDVRIWLNVVEQGKGVHPGAALMFPQQVDFVPPPGGRSLEFQVDPELLKNTNSLTISATREVQIEWIYVGVKQEG
jgi:hypothetical protein